MADNRIRVKLEPITVKPTGGVDKNKSKQATVGVKVTFTSKGKGATLATAASQPAVLTFFEVPAKKGPADANTAPRKFATLKGSISVDEKNVPTFDVAFQPLVYESFVRGPRRNNGNLPPRLSSDFRLRLVLPDGHFARQADTHGENSSLFLPWEFNGENRTLEIGVELEIAGQKEADLAANGPLDVPLTHPGVLEDGAGPAVLTYFGVGTVYPFVNQVFSDQKVTGKLKMPNKTLTINLHQGLDSRAKDINAVKKALVELFQDAKVTADVKVSQSDSAAQAAGFRRRQFSRGTAFMSANVQDLDAPLVGEGTKLPFFEYWVFFETKLTPNSSESGESEGIMSVDRAKGEKLVASPIHLLGGNDGGNPRPFERVLSLVATDADLHLAIANIVAHEVGHSLGFGHSVFLDGANKYQLIGNPTDRARGIMIDPNYTGGQVVLQRLSPLDKAVLERDYF